MVWSEDLSVGVPSIDKQHKALIEATNNLYDACKQGKGREKVLEMLDFLANYTVTHFRDEEGLQSKSGYPGYEAHKKLHAAFVKDFLALKKEVVDNGATITSVSKVYGFVSNWLVVHIKYEDTKIGKFINSVPK